MAARHGKHPIRTGPAARQGAERTASNVQLGPPSSLPFLGRARESTLLEAALQAALEGRGGAWLLEGPGGIGKTRLARWAEDRAVALGFHVAWGYGMRESLSAFFAFQQIFRREESRPAGAPATAPRSLALGDLGAVTLLADARATTLGRDLESLPSEVPCLWLSRDRPSSLRQRFPRLGPRSEVRWLTRAEAEGHVSPAHLDALGETITQFLGAHPGGVVAVGSLEYLVSQNSFLPVLRLVQFIRDVAESTGGHVLLTLTTSAMDPRERSLLEAEGTVVAPSGTPEDARAAAPEAPSMTLMRYLDRLESVSRVQPQLLVLDDLQWFDEPSLQAFQFLARNGRGLRVLFLATRREEEGATREGRGLDDVLDHMETEGLLHRLPLRGLPAEETWRLLESSLGGPLESTGPGDLRDRILERAGGNPYFALATAQMLIEEGRVQAHGAGRVLVESPHGTLALPTTVRRAVERRLRRLPVPEREILAAGAMLDREFELAPLAAALPMETSLLERRVLDLQSTHRILQPGSGKASWTFSQPVLREVALEEVPPERVPLLALGLARWWEAHRPQENETLARLGHLGRDPSVALPWVRRALDRSLEDPSAPGAVRLHRWLQELLAIQGVPLPNAVQEGLAVVERLQRGQEAPEAALRILRELESRHLPVPLRWQVAAALAEVLAGSDVDEGERRLRQLDADIGRATLPREFRARLALTRARLQLGHGDYAGVRRSCEAALQALGPEGDPWERCNALYFGGWAQKEENRWEEASDSLRQARALADELNATPLRVLCHSLEFSLALQRGALGEAQRAIAAAVLEGRLGGPVENLAVGLTNLAATCALRGDGPGAREALAEARHLARRFDMTATLAEADQREADLLLREGRAAQAEPLLLRAVATYRQLGARELLAPGLLSLAEARLDQGNTTGAEEALAEVGAGEASLQLGERPRLWRVRGRAEAARGLAQALPSLQRSLALAQGSQNRFEEAETRVALARWASTHGDVGAAERNAREARELFTACGVPPPPPGA